MEHFTACLATADVLSRLLTAVVVGFADASEASTPTARGFRLSRSNSAGEWLDVLQETLRRDPRSLKTQLGAADWVLALQHFLLGGGRRTDAEELRRYGEPVFHLRCDLVGDDDRWSRATPLRLLRWLVEIRNKTVAHGALGAEFWRNSVAAVSDAVDWLLGQQVIFVPDLLVVVPAAADKGPLGRVLRGLEPDAVVAAEGLDLGVAACCIESFFWELPPLVWVRASDNQTFLANGSWRQNNASAEFLCHAIAAASGAEGRTRRPLHVYASAPAATRPDSETGGLAALDASGPVLHNLPSPREAYVQRAILEAELRSVLRDPLKRHLVNVKGFGGIGKTSLVLHLSRELLTDPECPYSQIIWISARDVDLTLRGPKPVQQAAGDLEDIFALYAALWDEDPADGQALFASAIRTPEDPILLVLDNFETFDDQPDAYRYLDSIVQPPSKIVITSRHDFRGDFQVQVRGMELDEAGKLIRDAARRAHREGLIDQQAIESIFTRCQGHPYAMKLVASNVATKAGLGELLSRTLRDEALLDALFRASVSDLDDPSEFVFLLVSRFSNGVAEIALRVATTREEIELEPALRILHERSLAEFDPETQRYIVPAMAREFASKLLTGHVHRSNVEAVQHYLNSWPGLAAGHVTEAARAMEASVLTDGPDRQGRRTAETLRELAEHDGVAWQHLARVLRAIGAPAGSIDEAFKRAVEAEPRASRLFIEWAESVDPSDVDRRVELRIQAAMANPDDFKVASTVAAFLAQFHKPYKRRYDSVRWSSLIRPVIDVLDSNFERLDANECSRLAWLYLLIRNEGGAKRAVLRGRDLDEDNEDIKKLVIRLRI
jgi:hypothetical protein